jgi:hypothetical protein
MSKYVRVMLAWVDDLNYKIWVDLIIDEYGRSKSQVPTLGWVNDLKSTEMMPFVYHVDGRADFGAGFDDSADEWHRFTLLNIREKFVKVGEYVTYTEDGEEHTYRIARVTDLLTGQSI